MGALSRMLALLTQARFKSLLEHLNNYFNCSVRIGIADGTLSILQNHSERKVFLVI